MADNNKIRVLLVKPMETPRVVEIENTLEAKQEIVGGYIEPFHAWDDKAHILCDEDGSYKTPNRVIFDTDGIFDHDYCQSSERGWIAEVIHGDFIILSSNDETGEYESLTDEQIEKYSNLFKYPEGFFRTVNGVYMLSKKPDSKPVKIA